MEIYVGKNFIKIGNCASIRKEGDNFYAYDFGWVSPPLDIVGAWGLSESVGVNLEQFEESFGKLPIEMEETKEHFTKRFFVNGMLPVQIDAKPFGTLWETAIEGIVEDGEGDGEKLPELERYSLEEIFERIIKPTYSESIIEFGDKVKYNVLKFIKLNKDLKNELYYNIVEFIGEEINKK